MRRALVPLLIVVASVAWAAPAPATPITLKKAMWGPVERDGVSQFPIYADLGVGIYQYTVRWDGVAPTKPANPTDPSDPAYSWPSEIDEAVAQARKYHMQVSLLLIGTPGWANGGKPWNYVPDDARDLADFASAAAKRYPAVHHWMIWNEPTKAQNFQPLTPDDGHPLHGAGLLAPEKYAEMLDDSYGALKAVSKRNLVIGGNTFTVGTVAPLHWVKALKLPNGKRPRMDLWGHNPFSARHPELAAPPLGGGNADFSDLDTLAHALDKAFKHAPLKKEHHLKLFLSEFSLPTDHANYEFNFFVDRRTQARWLKDALKIARSYARVYTLGYLGLYDDPVTPAGDQVERGLITRSGVHKPAYKAFRNN